MTEYTIDAETDISTVAAGDEWTVFQTSTGRIKKATASEVATYVWSAAVSSASGTVTATGGTGTLSKLYGVITTASQTITGQAPASTITITNTTITAGDLLLATLSQGTNTTGIPVLMAAAGAGVMTFTLLNAATTATAAFAGTFIIDYAVIKK